MRGFVGLVVSFCIGLFGSDWYLHYHAVPPITYNFLLEFDVMMVAVGVSWLLCEATLFKGK